MNKLQWNFNQNTNIFFHKNASQIIVCEMAAILSRGRRVKRRIKSFLSVASFFYHLSWSMIMLSQVSDYI